MMQKRGPQGPTGRPFCCVVVPTHDTRYLRLALASVATQTAKSFAVVVAPNNGPRPPDVEQICTDAFADRPDIGWEIVPVQGAGVGAIKHAAFMAAADRADWLVELDHDDLLTPRALARIEQAAEAHPDATMIYSDVRYRGKYAPWSAEYGWEYHERGADMFVPIAPRALPQNLSRIWYAPDHVRAYRSVWYRAAGGHDVSLPVADDHDLTCRAWLDGPIIHIPEPLYEYRIHNDQTQKRLLAEIQSAQWAVYARHIERLALEWSRRGNALSLDLGGGINPRPGYVSVDRHNGQIRADLDQPWPFGDASCGAIRMADVAEHLRDPIHTMNEAWRCLCHGGFLFIRVPSTDGRAAFRDPTHVSFWNIESFWYYTQARYRRFIEPACRCRYQILRLRDVTEHGILYTEAHLLALHDGPRFHGLLEI